MRGGDAPAFLLFERDQSGLSGEHFDGDFQDAREQFLKIEFLGEGAGYFEQVVALSDAEIWEHRGVELILSLLDKRLFFRVQNKSALKDDNLP